MATLGHVGAKKQRDFMQAVMLHFLEHGTDATLALASDALGRPIARVREIDGDDDWKLVGKAAIRAIPEERIQPLVKAMTPATPRKNRAGGRKSIG